MHEHVIYGGHKSTHKSFYEGLLLLRDFLSRFYMEHPGASPYDDLWEGSSGGIGITGGPFLPSGYPSET